MSITHSLRQAAKLQERIEGLREQLASVLDKARSELASTPAEEITVTPRPGRPKMKKSTVGRRTLAPKIPATRGRKPAQAAGRPQVARVTKGRRQSPLKGVKRASSPSGPLAPAVVKVLATKKQPMNVRDILDGLLASGYHFNSAEPKKNLAARIYRLNGVKQVSAGLFAAV